MIKYVLSMFLCLIAILLVINLEKSRDINLKGKNKIYCIFAIIVYIAVRCLILLTSSWLLVNNLPILIQYFRG